MAEFCGFPRVGGGWVFRIGSISAVEVAEGGELAQGSRTTEHVGTVVGIAAPSPSELTSPICYDGDAHRGLLCQRTDAVGRSPSPYGFKVATRNSLTAAIVAVVAASL